MATAPAYVFETLQQPNDDVRCKADGKRAADHAFNIAFAREKVPH